MRQLRILEVQLRDNDPVSADAPGGIEQMCYTLDKHLGLLGHEMTFLGHEASAVFGRLIPVPREWCDDEELMKQEGRIWQIRSYEDMINGLDLSKYDVAINHNSELCASAFPIPLVTIMHMPPQFFYDPMKYMDLSRKGSYFVSVSRFQAGLYVARGLVPDQIILNGIDMNRSDPVVGKREYLFFIGRIVPEKGAHVAIDLAKQADMPLVIAGAKYEETPERASYFSRVMKQIDGEKIKYVGPVGKKDKIELMRNAAAVVIPTQDVNAIEESFGLAAAEAGWCGTPVIASSNGALPEIVEEGRTGFIRDSLEGMLGALTRLREIDPVACQESAVKRFSAQRMARDYESFLYKIARSVSFP
jgi:glycosyltransferase involved in cell wall biosynthesis